MSVVKHLEDGPKVKLVPPNPYGYVFLLAEVEPLSVATDVDCVEAVSIAPDHESQSSLRAALQRSTRPLRAVLSALEEVRAVSLFEAILFAPGSLERFSRAEPVGIRLATMP